METQVWATLATQGRMVKWLAWATGMRLKRLYALKYGSAAWWQDWEVEACVRALGVPRDYLFPQGARVLPPGRKRPVRTDPPGQSLLGQRQGAA